MSRTLGAAVASGLAMGLHAAWLLTNKPRDGDSTHPTLKAGDVARSCWPGADRLLFYYRALTFIYILAVGVEQVYSLGWKVFLFFTVWNWWLLIVYFGLTTAIMLRSPAAPAANSHSRKLAPSVGKTGASSRLGENGAVEGGPPSRAAKVASALLHIHLTTVWIIDAVTWLILVRAFDKVEDPVKREFWRRQLYSFTSYNQHAFNVVLIFTEMFLNAVPLQPYKYAYVEIFSLVYGLLALAHRAWAGRWLYPIYDEANPTTPFLLFASAFGSPLAAFTASRLVHAGKLALLKWKGPHVNSSDKSD